jgi:hypothetical protein
MLPFSSEVWPFNCTIDYYTGPREVRASFGTLEFVSPAALFDPSRVVSVLDKCSHRSVRRP